MQIKLQEGEQVLWEGKPEKKIFSMWFVTKIIPFSIAASFYTFMIIMFLWVFLVVMPSGRREYPFPVYLLQFAYMYVPFWLVFFFVYYAKLKGTFQYCITNQRCIFEGGIIIRRKRSVPYHKITDVEINQNIIERGLGISSLKVFTPGTGSAGMPGFEKAEIAFYGLKDAEMPANIIQNILKKYKATGE